MSLTYPIVCLSAHSALPLLIIIVVVGVALLFVIIIVCSAYWSPERPSSPLLLHKQQTQNTRKASGRSRLSSASDPSRILFGLPEAYEEDAFVCNG